MGRGGRGGRHGRAPLPQIVVVVVPASIVVVVVVVSVVVVVVDGAVVVVVEGPVVVVVVGGGAMLMIPAMSVPCTVQKYRHWPTKLNVVAKVNPAFCGPLSNMNVTGPDVHGPGTPELALDRLVTLWLSSIQTHRTVSPTVTSVMAGSPRSELSSQ